MGKVFRQRALSHTSVAGLLEQGTAHHSTTQHSTAHETQPQAGHVVTTCVAYFTKSSLLLSKSFENFVSNESLRGEEGERQPISVSIIWRR